MFDEPVLRKWMGLEISRINDGVVKERKRLSLLLTEETPSAMTRSGREYLFDRAVLRGILGIHCPRTSTGPFVSLSSSISTWRFPTAVFWTTAPRWQHSRYWGISLRRGRWWTGGYGLGGQLSSRSSGNIPPQSRS